MNAMIKPQVQSHPQIFFPLSELRVGQLLTQLSRREPEGRLWEISRILTPRPKSGGWSLVVEARSLSDYITLWSPTTGERHHRAGYLIYSAIWWIGQPAKPFGPTQPPGLRP